LNPLASASRADASARDADAFSVSPAVSSGVKKNLLLSPPVLISHALSQKS